MPTLSFVIGTGNFAKIGNAMAAYNMSTNVAIPLTGENEFAKQAFLDYLKRYTQQYRQIRVGELQQQLVTCDDATLTQISGLLGGG